MLRLRGYAAQDEAEIFVTLSLSKGRRIPSVALLANEAAENFAFRVEVVVRSIEAWGVSEHQV